MPKCTAVSKFRVLGGASSKKFATARLIDLTFGRAGQSWATYGMQESALLQYRLAAMAGESSNDTMRCVLSRSFCIGSAQDLCIATGPNTKPIYVALDSILNADDGDD